MNHKNPLGKKFLALLVALAMVFAMVPASAFAAGENEVVIDVSSITADVDNDNYKVIGTAASLVLKKSDVVYRITGSKSSIKLNIGFATKVILDDAAVGLVSTTGTAPVELEIVGTSTIGGIDLYNCDATLIGGGDLVINGNLTIRAGTAQTLTFSTTGTIDMDGTIPQDEKFSFVMTSGTMTMTPASEVPLNLVGTNPLTLSGTAKLTATGKETAMMMGTGTTVVIKDDAELALIGTTTSFPTGVVFTQFENTIKLQDRAMLSIKDSGGGDMTTYMLNTTLETGPDTKLLMEGAADQYGLYVKDAVIGGTANVSNLATALGTMTIDTTEIFTCQGVSATPTLNFVRGIFVQTKWNLARTKGQATLEEPLTLAYGTGAYGLNVETGSLTIGSGGNIEFTAGSEWGAATDAQKSAYVPITIESGAAIPDMSKITFTGFAPYQPKKLKDGTKTIYKMVEPANLSGATIGAIAAQSYTGSGVCPVPTVEFTDKTLVACGLAHTHGLACDGDFYCSYTNNVEIATAGAVDAPTVSIHGINGYTGTASAKFEIKKAESSGGGNSRPNKPTPPPVTDEVKPDLSQEESKDDKTTITVSQENFDKKLESAATGATVIVPIANEQKSNTVEATLVVQNLVDMAKKEMTLEIKTGNVSYQLPASSVDIDALKKELGAGADLSSAPLTVTIAKSDEQSAAKVESIVTEKGAALVIPPLEFTVKATYEGKTTEIKGFSAYVPRDVEISAEQAKRITTAVVVEADGTLRHVPTYVYQKSGKWFAKVNSRTNSIYALIQNDVSFSDAAGEWYAEVVNEMGSRKVIAGNKAGLFDGDAQVTRAEFASMLVKALGLSADGGASFADVASDAWYAGVVGAAAEQGLVKGDGRGFRPNDTITRQEAMAMVENAAKLTQYKAAGGGKAGAEFADYGTQDSWAKGAVDFNLSNGFITGYNGKIRPKDEITRAEAAAVVLKLLQKSELVDIRTKL